MPVISAILAPRFAPLPSAIFEASLSGGPPRRSGDKRRRAVDLRHVSHQTAVRQDGAWDPARPVIALPWTAIGATLCPLPRSRALCLETEGSAEEARRRRHYGIQR